MMNNLDDMLVRLRDDPVPIGLASLDASIVAGVHRRREALEARRGLMLAGAIAILVGVGGTLVPGGPAAAEPLLGMPYAAPSHLLVD
jgi:hypothetical protein